MVSARFKSWENRKLIEMSCSDLQHWGCSDHAYEIISQCKTNQSENIDAFIQCKSIYNRAWCRKELSLPQLLLWQYDQIVNWCKLAVLHWHVRGTMLAYIRRWSAPSTIGPAVNNWVVWAVFWLPFSELEVFKNKNQEKIQCKQ